MLNPTGAFSCTTSVMAAMACPELYPGASLPWIVTERAALKRLMMDAPVLTRGLKRGSSGTKVPVLLLTKTNFIASASLRYMVSDCTTTL